MNDGVRPKRAPRTLLWIGASILAIAAMAAIAGPVLTPYDPASQELALRLEGPSGSHLFGLDELGRDILARVLAGARISFLVGLTVVSVSALVGTVLGAVAAYFGGVVDDLISRLVDILLAFPGLLLAIALVAVLGPSLGNVLFALTIIGWVGYARLVRGQVLRAREFEYVQAARALGAGAGRVLWRHLIPTALPAVLVQATLGMAGAIISEAALSFLGLGVQPPTPSWGTMLNGGRAHLLDAPHLTLFPGLAIALLVLGFNFVGDGLRDLADPREQR
jgi:peptide/nickel transport system permease protein